MEDESNTPEPSGDWLSETKNWLQDNIRIVLSIVIVLAIALGVYSYSNRGDQEPGEEFAANNMEEIDIEELIEEEPEALTEEEKEEALKEAKEIAREESDTTQEEQPDLEEQKQMEAEQQAEEDKKAEEQKKLEEQQRMEEQQRAEEAKKLEEEKKAEEQRKLEEAAKEAADKVAQENTQQQPETVISQSSGTYEVTAATGDSLTTLARSAVKQYLDTNNDSSITAEHKIYIEDYLARKMGYSDQLNIGETKSFSEQNIQEAIAAAKTLTPDQLNHLKIYSQRVGNL